jgi:hypothetical protein
MSSNEYNDLVEKSLRAELALIKRENIELK